MADLAEQIAKALDARAEDARNPDWGDAPSPPLDEADRDRFELLTRIGGQGEAIALLADAILGPEAAEDVKRRVQRAHDGMPMTLNMQIHGPMILPPDSIPREMAEVVSAQQEAIRAVADGAGATPRVESEIPEVPEAPDATTLLAVVVQQQAAIVELARGF